MYYCTYCRFCTLALENHLKHHSFHRNVNKFINCGFNRCSKFFKCESHLKKHLYRTHSISHKQENPCSNKNANEFGKFICSKNLCKKECDTLSLLIKHLKLHIAWKEEVQCPFQGCSNKYKIISSFTSHLTKKHRRQYTKISNDHEEHFNAVQSNSSGSQTPGRISEDLLEADQRLHIETPNTEMEPPDYPRQTDEENPNLFLNNIAQFYLKLETECMLPSSTIQKIVEEVSRLHGEAQEVIKEKLNQKFATENIASETVIQIIDEVFCEDPMIETGKKLNSDYKRNIYYKNKYEYVKPQFITISQEKQTFFAYVPILQTITCTLKDKSIMNEFDKPRSRGEGVIESFVDGNNYKHNKFFQNNPDALRVILYQDAFEVVNPIGAAKKKHKLLGVYMNLDNISDHLRSHTSTMRLVALCKENDFDHATVYGAIVEDIKKLEQGVNIEGKVYKGTIAWISGDNLGSHGLGGFTENFSRAKYICRFCLIHRDELEEKRGVTKECVWRTEEQYRNALKCLKNSNNKVYQGVKFDSIFNQLEHYHVCRGLPPCVGHDGFEGVIAYDTKLFIDYFIKNKWFKLEELNKWIDKYPYSIEDRADKPCIVKSEKDRIIGGACQIWNFLRVLPLLIEDRIEDFENEVFKSLLLLSEIFEIICAPTIHTSYLAYLNSLIYEYLHLRESLFPGEKMRPKHHFLKHYVQLILDFGPMIKVWTLRFEAKHRFSKRLIRSLLNFKNVIKTASEKHELYQCYVRLGADVRLDIDLGEESNFNSNMYHADIISAIKKAKLSQNIRECSKLISKGTEYKKGYALAIRQTGCQENIILGKISMILSCNEADAYILLEVMESELMLQNW